MEHGNYNISGKECKSNIKQNEMWHAMMRSELNMACQFNTPPQAGKSLNSVAKCLTLAEGSAFVSVSATMLFVGQ